MRINKYIAHHTKYSRREADELIKNGDVSINKRKLTDFSYDVKDGDFVTVKGRLVKPKKEITVIVTTNPKGHLLPKKMTEAEPPYTINFQVSLDILYL